MIIVQTPLRVSLFGGGTDFPDYFREEGGCVLGTAINKYIFVIIKERFDRKLRIGYTRTEMVDHVDEIQHELIREALRKTGIRHGVEVATMGDVPAAGSGLGSSSSVTVGALHAMYIYKGEMVPAEQIARQACEIEIDILGKPIGIQDQYLAAYGGLRLLEFEPQGEVRVKRVVMEPATKRRLDENLLLFFTGITRLSKDILGEQQKNISGKVSNLRQLKHLAYQACELLESNDLDSIGELLHESWLLKKQLASQISNGEIDDLYAAARQAGAIGGKISGAGGGGFLLLYCPVERQAAVRVALSHLQELSFSTERDGTKVIFNYQRS